MEIVKKLLLSAESTPKGSRNTMAHRDLMYDLSVRIESVKATIPPELINGDENQMLDRAQTLVDGYYSNLKSFGVTV